MQLSNICSSPQFWAPFQFLRAFLHPGCICKVGKIRTEFFSQNCEVTAKSRTVPFIFAKCKGKRHNKITFDWKNLFISSQGKQEEGGNKEYRCDEGTWGCFNKTIASILEKMVIPLCLTALWPLMEWKAGSGLPIQDKNKWKGGQRRGRKMVRRLKEAAGWKLRKS